jgi:creatinine amidohydrolase
VTGAFLESLAWPEAAEKIAANWPVLLPIGAAAKEHGPHLPLDTDARSVRAVTKALVGDLPVLAAPVVGFGYYPVFTDYAGSQSLGRETFTALLAELIEGFAQQGVRRIAVLNSGVSTEPPIRDATARFDGDSALQIEILDFRTLGRGADGLLEQDGGGHADEHETSIMLAIAPETVRMDLAVPATGAGAPGAALTSPVRFSPDPASGAAYNPTGATGDPSLASPEKGRAFLAALIEDCRSALTARWPDLIA